MGPNLAIALEFAFLLAMAVAAFRDLAAWSLPNWLSLSVAFGYVPWAWASGASWSAIGLGAGAGFLVLAIGFGLFSVNLWGAGDAKLAAAVALWIGFSLELLRFFLVMSLAGGVLAVIALAIHAATGAPQLPPDDPGAEIAKRNPLKAKTRYGAAIAVGGLDYWLRHSQGVCLVAACAAG